MKKILLELNDNSLIHWMFKEAQTANFELQDLQEFLTTWSSKDLSHLRNSNGLSYENLHL